MTERFLRVVMLYRTFQQGILSSGDVFSHWRQGRTGSPFSRFPDHLEQERPLINTTRHTDHGPHPHSTCLLIILDLLIMLDQLGALPLTLLGPLPCPRKDQLTPTPEKPVRKEHPPTRQWIRIYLAGGSGGVPSYLASGSSRGWGGGNRENITFPRTT